MLKKLLLISCLLILSNCSAPGTALLGPAFTGAKTGSVYQASLSFGTGKVISKLNSSELFLKINNEINTTTATSFNIYNEKKTNILLSYKVDKVEFSELIEPEPLP